MKKIILTILCLISLSTYAQGWLSFSGNVSQNYLYHTHGGIELLGGYSYKNFSCNAGIGAIFSSEESRFNSLQIQASYLFDIPKFPLEVKTGYLFLPHTNTFIQEHIWHIQAGYRHPHVDVTFGYFIRTYASKNTTYSEFSNILYCIQAYVWEKDNQYNLDFAISNYNDFYIDKHINPHIRIRGSYAYPQNLKYFIEGLYGGSGVGNIYFEHFQWGIKLGLIWNI